MDPRRWLLLLAACLLVGCVTKPGPVDRRTQVHRLKPPPSAVAAAFRSGGPYAEGSMYACLIDAYYQGVPIQQALTLCQMNLVEDADMGFGHDPWAASGMPKPAGSSYDPEQVRGVCKAGDSRIAAGEEPLQEGCAPIGSCGRVSPTQFFGVRFTFGGRGTRRSGCDDDGNCGLLEYKGLTETQAAEEKLKAVEADGVAAKELRDLIKKQTEELAQQGKKPEDWEKDPAMKAARDAATKKYEDASKKADKDPNVVVHGVTRPAPRGGSECEQALQAAREFLRECNRVGWKSYECQSLQARTKDCPDPAAIFVDPGSGYACGQGVDTTALLEAWRQRCQALRRPVPGGPDPCELPRVSRNGRVLRGNPDNPLNDPCHNVFARIDPESPECAGVITVQSFGQPDVQQLLVFGLNKLGGPTWVIPAGPKTGGDRPPPGDPRPTR